jgi:hypothetical protein
MLKIKFVLLLMLLFFIVDSKKLRNKLTTKWYHCSTYGTKCGTVYGECCPGFICQETDCVLLIFCSGICLFKGESVKKFLNK